MDKGYVVNRVKTVYYDDKSNKKIIVKSECQNDQPIEGDSDDDEPRTQPTYTKSCSFETSCTNNCNNQRNICRSESCCSERSQRTLRCTGCCGGACNSFESAPASSYSRTVDTSQTASAPFQRQASMPSQQAASSYSTFQPDVPKQQIVCGHAINQSSIRSCPSCQTLYSVPNNLTAKKLLLPCNHVLMNSSAAAFNNTNTAQVCTLVPCAHGNQNYQPNLSPTYTTPLVLSEYSNVNPVYFYANTANVEPIRTQTSVPLITRTNTIPPNNYVTVNPVVSTNQPHSTITARAHQMTYQPQNVQPQVMLLASNPTMPQPTINQIDRAPQLYSQPGIVQVIPQPTVQPMTETVVQPYAMPQLYTTAIPQTQQFVVQQAPTDGNILPVYRTKLKSKPTGYVSVSLPGYGLVDVPFKTRSAKKSE